MKGLFRGGVHPHDDKGATADKPIRRLPTPEMVYVHLSQHVGAPAEPMVKRGDEVTVGQPIGSPAGFISAAVHSPVTGKVKTVGPWPHPGVGRGTAVHIERTSDVAFPMEERAGWRDLSKEEMIDLVKAAGITGLGGASFPTHVKLSPPPEKSLDTLLINGAECEPRLTADHRMMVEEGAKIVEGIKLIQKILGVENAVIGIEDNKPDAIQALSPLLEEAGVGMNVLPTRYPQGGEKQMIKAILGREVPPPPGLPMDVGVVVQNVGTAMCVYEAVAFGKPLMERVVTVTGDLVAEPGNILAPLGTTFKDLVEFCGGSTADPSKVIMGGPMMGIAQHTLDAPMIKGTSGLLLLSDAEGLKSEFLTCITCARCIDVCPLSIRPNIIGTLVEFEKMDNLEHYFPEDCMECGCCAYICPSKRPLVHFLKVAKAEVWNRQAQAREALAKKENNG